MAKKTHREEAVDWLASNDRWLTRLPEELNGLHKSTIQHSATIKELCTILNEFVERVRRLEEELAKHQLALPVEQDYIYPPGPDFFAMASRRAFYQSLFGRLGT